MAETSEDDTNQEAFLLSWDGTTWRDVVRLHQGQVITVGRSATNKLVLHDDACSRNHCEVFHSDGVWQVRDLESRNGTLVNEHPVEGNLKLRPGDVVCIGQCRLAFTTSLDSQPRLPDAGTNVTERETSLSASATPHEEPPILHRSIVPQFLTAEAPPGRQSGHEKELARLYRLGLEMGAAETRQQLTEVVLKSLAAETVADISAVLLARPNAAESVAPADLLVVAYDSRKDLPYRRVSDNLSRVVLSSREAVLARDVEDDQQLAVFDSLGEMRAMSVICAPIHCDDQVRGLVHLYATNPDNALDKHDLEYTLAVARQLALALDHLSERDSLKSGLAQARNVNKSLRQHFDTEFKLIGDSSAMTDLREKIVLIAETHANVLIRGESGCGKELIARNIHFNSPRREGPFVCLNCAALNENLLESELFGHEKGAFTGASDRKIGRFEQAHQGTLFLDEVGEMSTAIQAKFLRALEGHPFERIGGRKPIEVDVRIVAATNKDLEEAVEGGDFRKDLYFRLHVAELIARPLRERPDDIPILAEFFLQKFVEKTGRVISGYSEDAQSLLTSYDWPGNVRELQNTIERTVILCRNEIIRGTDVQLSSFASRLSSQPTLPAATVNYHEMSLSDVERDHILATLDFTDWNKSQAAQILGIERSTLDRKLKRYHVSRPE
ncbi:MAG: sigma 54-interacting transcriptional regulator [Fuerstiella sp.]|jgi:Nif-specific regulatory protein|nr:sigma 54-interacting transcriptional regulator [Fuerstiella sp.]